MKYDKQYATSEEKYLKTVVLYAVGDYLCADEDGENKVDKDTVVNMFVKNMLVLRTNGNLFVPTQLDVTEEYADVAYLTESSSTLALAHVYSKEYTA